jgi:cell division protein FtsI (penicillin-binding protein 3)
MAKPAARIAAIQFCFAVGITAVVARAAQLQLVQGARWSREAEAQRTERAVLPAARGTIYDRNGVPLAITQEFYHVGVAPNELTDRRAAVAILSRQLRLPAGQVDRELARKKWAYWHGPFTATQVQPLRGVKGIHLDGEFLRFYPASDLARPIIGGLSPETGAGAAGLELSLDSMLAGQPGEAVLLKDRAGRRYDSPSRVIREPVAGHDVWLTLDAGLQEIAERGLADALTQMKAEGGDVVFLDPATGEVLAVASRQADGTTRPSIFTDPFEPGSTAKLFTAAALLEYHRVDSTDAVSGENGVYLMPVNERGKTRRITDAEKHPGMLTLAKAIQVSSNIAMSKFSQRLSPEEQYGVLRDFGGGRPRGQSPTTACCWRRPWCARSAAPTAAWSTGTGRSRCAGRRVPRSRRSCGPSSPAWSARAAPASGPSSRTTPCSGRRAPPCASRVAGTCGASTRRLSQRCSRPTTPSWS